MTMTDGRGVDTAIEAVGIPATFELCQQLVAPGGVIANIGVHGTKVDLHLESLWDRNITITTRLVDTVSTPMLLKSLGSKNMDPRPADHPSIQARPHSRSLRNIWSRGQNEGAQGDHRSLMTLRMPRVFRAMKLDRRISRTVRGLGTAAAA